MCASASSVLFLFVRMQLEIRVSQSLFWKIEDALISARSASAPDCEKKERKKRKKKKNRKEKREKIERKKKEKWRE